MSTSKPMTREAVSRIARATANKYDGKIPAGGVASRVDAELQKREAKSGKKTS